MNKEEVKMYNEMDQYHLNEQLVWSALYGRFNEVKELLTSPKLIRRAQVRSNDSGALIHACKFANIESIKFQLTSPELKEHADVHTNEDECFKFALKHANKSGNTELLDYFIFDYKIKMTPTIKELIQDKPTLMKMFETRDLNDNLHQNLKKTEIIEQSKMKL